MNFFIKVNNLKYILTTDVLYSSRFNQEISGDCNFPSCNNCIFAKTMYCVNIIL